MAAYIKELESIEQWLGNADDARRVSASAKPWGVTKWLQVAAIAAAFGGKSQTEVTLTEFFAQPLGPEDVSIVPPPKRHRGNKTAVSGLRSGESAWFRFLKVKVNVALPRTAKEFTGALTQLEKYFLHFPPLNQTGRARQTQMLRKFAVSMLQRMPRDAARAIPWGEVSAAMPNEGGRMSVFNASDSLGEIEDQIGVNPLLVTAWCHLIASVPEAFLKEYLIKPPAKIMGAIKKLRGEAGKPVEWNALVHSLGSESLPGPAM